MDDRNEKGKLTSRSVSTAFVEDRSKLFRRFCRVFVSRTIGSFFVRPSTEAVGNATLQRGTGSRVALFNLGNDLRNVHHNQ